MKNFIQKHKWGLLLILAGGIAGYLYWFYIGCNTGTCPITSIWYSNTLLGGFIGYLAGDSIDEYINKKKQKQNGKISETHTGQ